MRRLVPIQHRYSFAKAYSSLFGQVYALWRVRQAFDSRKRVLFMLLNPVQDSQCYDMLAPHLKQKYWVEECRIFDTQRLRYFRPDLLVVSETISDGSIRLCSYAKKKTNGRVRILNIHGEGVISAATEKLWAGGTVEDLEVVWGPEAKRILLGAGKNPEKVLVCGNPRFDRYALKLFASREQFCRELDLDPARRTVLYASSFSLTPVSKREGAMFDWPMEQWKALRYSIGLAIRNIAARHPEIQFVVKPHPSEWGEFYSQMMGELQNCRIVSMRPGIEKLRIYDLVSNVDAVIHWASTVSSEAWMVKVPTISCQFVDLGALVPNIIEGSYIARNEVELENLLMEFLDGKSIDEVRKSFQMKFIADWYYLVDGKSTDRVLALIDNMLRQVDSIVEVPIRSQ